MNEYFESLLADLSLTQQYGFNPYYQRIQKASTDCWSLDGKNVSDFASNNYLGLAGRQEVKDAFKAGVEAFGTSLCGTPIASGNSDPLAELCNRFANFVGLEDSLVFPSCYQANNAVLAGLLPQGSLILFDHYLHASFVQGIKLTGHKMIPFKHNDIVHLEKILSSPLAKAASMVAVVTESVFSTEGSIAPFADIYALCCKYKALSVIDDSHGIGVIGKSGRGILEHAAIANFDGIYTASLGKALAVSGGAVAGSSKLIEVLKYSCPALIYSTSILPAAAAALLEVIRLIEKDFPVLSSRLYANASRLREGLKKAGFTIMDAEAPIISVLTGDDENTLILSKAMQERGIYATPFVPPSVPPGSSVIRMIAKADFDFDLIDQTVSAMEDVWSQL